MGSENEAVFRIAVVGELHCSKASRGKLRPIFTQAAAQDDILALCGDLTDVALPLLRRVFPDGPGFRLLEVRKDGGA